ncbi:zinc-dependent MarR family transcriptional regulator [Streptococcus pseudoporcinus]|uniref:MarR family transcriptional regulator n=2 Tax=Streptococcus pseudoporcinus TaxID=361101 RepID=A0A4U9XHC0_9STRE|nr:zinc-dependent MarR family transcriptional regulator [Streptococcus pseudoporcinus]EFR43643.1 transcriptional regulator, MarR family [Streptococcus pseudoporcinus SPIN 20026]EHI64104.1 sugar-specific transcriptional regulator, TrmB family [Streptococcus pseudoporcinus LQ 940-04]VEF93763.1 MarR family transcriptional regulator [Streptococcus pseudoporcinus]VTS12326.1 MarR family transcriptional regulator [Streptococcus pseudoporcinus]VTS13434.1 MarR family transcriptional regulator [Streptoc
MGTLEKKIDTLVNQILLKAENQHELLFGACQSDVKLTNTQEHILMLLSQDKLTNTELAKLLNISQAAVTKAIKGLINQGMLATTKDAVDARVTYFELTPLAKPIAEEHTHHHDETLNVYTRLLGHFSDQETKVIEKFLTVFSDELER